MPHQERLPQRKDKVKEKQMLSRHIDFEGMSNVRDLGGMTGAAGKKIKSGLLFRSDQLHSATKADQEKLKEIGVKYIVDLRNIREYTEQPDRGCGRFLGPELSNSKTASILHRTQTP